ncbi:MAG: iron-sulfur cluster assembly scaffold protein [bacterium]|nr:iron-sulfur cluster assembly scaffold protein [bacterium]
MSKLPDISQDGAGWVYSDKVKDHFLNPRNFISGKIDIHQFDGVGEVGSPACGDLMRVFIKVAKDRITECKWQTFGCASAIASTSVMSEMVTGMTLEEAGKIRPQDIVSKLDGLPARKIHCSVLGDQALRAAIVNYKSRRIDNEQENI